MLVSIDYLINAGAGTAVSRGALLRLADDLVLDEVDAYAPEALVAVLRLIRPRG